MGMKNKLGEEEEEEEEAENESAACAQEIHATQISKSAIKSRKWIRSSG